MNGLYEIIKTDRIAILLGPWAGELTVFSVILRLSLSLILSFALGCERSSKRHSAGLRTFVLISFASTLSALLDLILMPSFPLLSAFTILAVASISINSLFLSSRSQIKGLTTSACLWATLFMGLSSGYGLYTLTLIIFIFLISIVALFPQFERYLKNRSNHFEVHLELKDPLFLQDYVSVCRVLGLRIDDIESNPSYRGSGLSVYTITLTILSEELKAFKTHKEIISALSTLEYVYHIEELI